MVLSIIFYVHPYLGKISNLTNSFQRGWNHQPDMFFLLGITSRSRDFPLVVCLLGGVSHWTKFIVWCSQCDGMWCNKYIYFPQVLHRNLFFVQHLATRPLIKGDLKMFSAATDYLHSRYMLQYICALNHIEDDKDICPGGVSVLLLSIDLGCLGYWPGLARKSGICCAWCGVREARG